MDRILDDLFNKRGSTREKALSSLIESLTVNYRCQFAEKNFATLLYRCLNSFKKGSSQEITLASHTLTLLAITMGSGDNAHELYKESLPVLSEALKSKTEPLLLSVINCIAITTFVGGNDLAETEASLEIIWQLINSKSEENAIVNKHPAPILSASISAWSLLLTTLDSWNVSHNYWSGAISSLLDLLEEDDQSVCMEACAALALICEVGPLEKFDNTIAVDDIKVADKGKNISNQLSSAQELQEIISSHAERLLRQTSLESSATKTVNGWNNHSIDVLKALKDGHFREISLKIGKHKLQLHSLSQLLQVNFIKRYLGRGFVRHMLENEFLHDVFNFTPMKQKPGDEPYISEREEVVVHLFVPEHKQRDCEDDDSPKSHRSTGAAFRKAKTQLLNKQRMIKGEELRPFDD